MNNCFEAYDELVQSSVINRTLIEKHVSHYLALDKMLPNIASFFLIADVKYKTYPFIGLQQEKITGYPNKLFSEKGMEFFVQFLHPEERDVILLEVFPEFAACVLNTPEKDKQNLQLNYNYRFKKADNTYINLMEYCYILELDKQGRSALNLIHTFLLEPEEKLPLKWSARIVRADRSIEQLFTRTHHKLHDGIFNLTSREMDILRNLAMGKTSKQIGKELFISPHTVDTHRRTILKKLKCKSVVELARVAFENGVV